MTMAMRGPGLASAGWAKACAARNPLAPIRGIGPSRVISTSAVSIPGENVVSTGPGIFTS